MKTVLERFESKFKVIESGCWEWTANLYKNGYGQFWMNGYKIGAHRASYMLNVSADFFNEMYVLHKCDNRKCVNPDHLFLGTAKENTQDCINKGRFVKFSQEMVDRVAKLRTGVKFSQERKNNMSEAQKKSGKGRGENNSKSKLKEEDVVEIRQIYSMYGGVNNALMGKEYGVSKTIINRIVNNQSWKHIL